MEYVGLSDQINLAKTDTDGNILSNIAFTHSISNFTNTIIPYSSGFIAGGPKIQGNNSSDMIRFDNSGNVLWAKNYSNSNGFQCRPVIVDEVNNVILSIASLVSGIGNNFPVYILKTDMNGAVISLNGYEISNASGIPLIATDLIKLNSGNYLFVASQLVCPLCYSPVFLELDTSFNIISSKKLLTAQGDPTHTIKYVKKPDDGLYIIGNFLNNSPSYDTHGFIINLSPSLSQVWAKYTNNISGPYGLLFTDGKLMPSGGLMVGGTYTSHAGYDDMLLMKVDSSGNLNWAKAIGDSSNDERLSSFVYQPNDAVYLAGNGYDTAQSAGTINTLFLKTTLSGNTTCGSISLPVVFNSMNVVVNNQPFTAISLTVTSSTLTTSAIPGFSFIPSCDGVVSGIENNDLQFSEINIFPNPSSSGFQISNINFQTKDEIILRNISGKIYFTKKIISPTSNFKLQTLNFPNGIYFLELKTKEGGERSRTMNKKVVVQH